MTATPAQRTADADIAPDRAETLTFSVTVTFTMNPDQRAAYADEYSIEASEVADQMRQDASDGMRDVLRECYPIREFTSYAVADPR